MAECVKLWMHCIIMKSVESVHMKIFTFWVPPEPGRDSG